MNIAIVDDLPMDQERLQKALMTYAAIHRLSLDIHVFSSAEEFLADYQPLKYTILFLDIFMEGMTGIEAAAKVREADDEVLLVYLTTSEEHRAQAFETYASAYLVKSPDDSVLYKTMDHLLHLCTEREEKRFFFVCDRQNMSLRYDDIMALQTEGNYILLRTVKGDTFKTRMLFSDAAKEFSKDKRFLSIVRGVIVNLDHVQSITEDTCQLVGDLSFPLNTRKARTIQQIWHNYNFEKLRRLSLGREKK